MKPALLRFSCVVLLLIASVGAVAASPQDAATIARRVDEHYNHLQTLTAEFTQTYQGVGVQRTEAGTLWLKRPGKMRWEYRQPKSKVFVGDGKAVWFYVSGEKQATRGSMKQLDDLQSPLAYLLGRAHLEKQMSGLSLASDVQPVGSGNVVLRGVPRGMEARVHDVLLEIDEAGRLVRIVISEADDSTTEYRFSEQKENLAISDDRFRFEPHAGVAIVQGNLAP